VVVAFVPWIVYWVLAGRGDTTAAALGGLGVSLAINVYRWAIRKVKIMDMISLVFLSISAFVTLILKSDLMVFYGGVLADMTLALMAWGSLVARNPFTYDYAKEDWDKAFWDDPIFVETNQITTAMWGVIFTAQAVIGGMAMALNLSGTPRLIFVAVIPRALLVIAIAFSAWFPRWYPAKAAARRRRRSSSGATAASATADSNSLTGLRLIEAMPAAFNAQVAGDVQATIQYHLGGEGGGVGYLKIEAGRCAFYAGQADRPTLTITSPAEVWTAISQGKLDGAEAFLNGSYRAEGDLGMLMRLSQLFSAAPQA
jgi:putative sterol carrier protein